LIDALAGTPDTWSVAPLAGFAASGLVGGPFSGATQEFTLTNSGSSPLHWGILNTSLWLNASPVAGVLPSADQTTFTASVTAAAANLGVGAYTANLIVTNGSGGSVSLLFTLQVQPLVQNGGFETGDFSYWALTGSSRYSFVTNGNGFAHSGNFGAALGQFGSMGYLSQNLSTSPGQVYLLSVWLDNPINPYGATPNQFVVQWNGTQIFSQTNIPFIAWTNLQFSVTATGTNSLLQLGFEDTPNYLGLDDISLTPVPTPRVSAARKTPTTIELTWRAIVGMVYQVQFKTSLDQPDWSQLIAPVHATNSTASASDKLGPDAQRFYRVSLLP
jgi:hypothetical protein